MRTMKALAAVDDDADVAAHLVGTLYELALRLGKTPRTIADDAFCALAHDELWRDELEPALRNILGRE